MDLPTPPLPEAMPHLGQLLQAEFQALFLRLFIFDHDGLDLRLHGPGQVPDQGGPGAADEVFGQRIPPLGECEGDGHAAFRDFHVVHHAEVHDVAVAFAGMMHFPQGLQNIFFRHHYSRTRFISFNR